MRLSFALAFGLSVLPVAIAAEPAEAPPASKETVEQPADETAQDSVAEEKRICRNVKLDTASRRKTKVCRTSDEWRELNNPR